MEDSASMAYDVQVLKEVYMVQGLVSSYFGKWQQACRAFHKAVDLANETGIMEEKKEALIGLGVSYKEQKNYRIAIRCYKKLLEVAWDLNDSEAEIAAYEGLSK